MVVSAVVARESRKKAGKRNRQARKKKIGKRGTDNH